MASGHALKQRAFHHNQSGIGALRLCEITSTIYVYEIFAALGSNAAVTSKREINRASQMATMSDKKPTGADQPKRQCDECGSKEVICTHSDPTKRCG
jgi:hypothetical protein